MKRQQSERKQRQVARVNESSERIASLVIKPLNIAA